MPWVAVLSTPYLQQRAQTRLSPSESKALDQWSQLGPVTGPLSAAQRLNLGVRRVKGSRNLWQLSLSPAAVVTFYIFGISNIYTLALIARDKA